MLTEVEGTLFQRGDGVSSPEVFTTVGEVETIPELSPTREIRDVTSINDLQFKFSPGLKNGGPFTVAFRYKRSDAAHIGFVNDFENKTERNYRIVLTDSPNRTIEFRGVIGGVTGPTGAPNDFVRLSVDMQVVEGPTWSA